MTVKKSVRYNVSGTLQIDIMEDEFGLFWFSMVADFLISPKKQIEGNGFFIRKSEGALSINWEWFEFDKETWALKRSLIDKSLEVSSFLLFTGQNGETLIGKTHDEEDGEFGSGFYLPYRYEDKVFYHEISNGDFQKECEDLFHDPQGHEIHAFDVFETMITPKEERTLDDAEVTRYFDDFTELRIFYRGDMFPVEEAYLYEETRKIVKDTVENIYRGVKLHRERTPNA